MEYHNYNLEDKIITSKDYEFHRNPPIQYKLHEKVICYFDGYNRKVVSFSIATSFPIIYDKFIGTDENIRDITIAICPFTLSSIVLDGKYKATSYVENSCLVITNSLDVSNRRDNSNSNSHTFSILNCFDDLHKTNKRLEVDIKILRNVFTEYPDCKYMVLSDNIIADPILNSKYYYDNNILFKYIKPPNEFHMKTLVYLIQYISSKDQSMKTTIIVGRDANAKENTGYDLKKSGVYDYLATYHDKIKLKFGFTMPILWFAWKSFYPDAKIVYIP